MTKQTQKEHSKIEKQLHPRNQHNHGYDFLELAKAHPPLNEVTKSNAYGNLSIDFSDPIAVKVLNAALLKKHYGVNHWDIPNGALCPPIPGRVDYIHYVAELLGSDLPNSQQDKKENSISLLDIGTGASGIYTLLASSIYGWKCVGSDINQDSLNNIEKILVKNPELSRLISLRIQHEKHSIFKGIIHKNEHFDISVCNPPFYSSADEARKANQQKVHNLAKNRDTAVNKNTSSSQSLNFGGIDTELWCNGGERLFVKKMITESAEFAHQCHWFTCLMSKKENIKTAKKQLTKVSAQEVKEIEMKQGNKVTRVLAWRFT